MQKTSYQAPELRDDNNNIIRPGAYGKNTAFCTPNNKGVLDYVNNNLEAHEDKINLLLQASGQYSNLSSINDKLIYLENNSVSAVQIMNSTTNADIDAITRADEVA